MQMTRTPVILASIRKEGRMGNKAAGIGIRTVRRRCEEYFARCDAAGTLYGEAGLALCLGVSLDTLRAWYDGEGRPEVTGEIRRAYLRIQSQLETSPVYAERGMANKALLLMKRPRLGGSRDRGEEKPGLTVHVKLGKNMEESDFL